MFGYVSIDSDSLSKDAQKRYSAYYCGLCHTLDKRFGNLGRMTLSNDMTFLAILLSSLYEPDEAVRGGRCPLHPLKKRDMLENEFSEYAADMNVVLAYYKGLDDWQDDRSPAGLMQSKLLAKAYRAAEKRHPDKCAAIRDSLGAIGELERQGSAAVDSLANQTARMLGEIYAVRDDYWQSTLRVMGESLGRFIYLMDAYEDLPRDERRNRFNPLRALKADEQYELLCRDSLSMMIAECTEAFELLPLQKDVDILRNILYSGVWTRYQRIWQKIERARKDTMKETEARE